jgi:flagellar biosynthesis/type III secretory pathway chaperone
MMHESSTIWDQLSSLLDVEKQLLLSGQLDALGDLGAQKSALIEQMSRGEIPVNAAQSSVLRRRAQENGQLYEAALKGIRRANARLHDVKSVLSELKTYSGRGTIRSDGVGGPSMSFKA